MARLDTDQATSPDDPILKITGRLSFPDLSNFRCLDVAAEQTVTECVTTQDYTIQLRVANGRSTGDKPENMATAMRSLTIGDDDAGTQRGLEDAIPEAANDFLKLLAEIAVDHAKDAALRLASERLRVLACEEFVSGDGETLVPLTCKVISSTSIQDLPAHARQLLDALMEDALAYLLDHNAKGKKALATLQDDFPMTMETLTSQVYAAIRGTAVEPRRLARAVVVSLAHDLADKVERLPASAMSQQQCVLSAVLLIVQRCQDAGCSDADIIRYATVSEAKEHLYECGQSLKPEKLKALPWGRIAGLAGRAIELLDSTADSTGKIGRDGILLVFDLLDLYYSQMKDDESRAFLASLREIIVGAMQRDAGRAVTALLALVQTEFGNSTEPQRVMSHAAAQQVARVIGALSGYAATYGTDAPQDAAAVREARKQAIESAIKILSSREGRGGQQVISLVATPGLHGGTSHEINKPGSPSFGALYVPVGLAWQLLPGTGSTFNCDGAYAMVYPLDIGWYLHGGSPDARPQWYDILRLGVQLGASFGTASDAFTVGIDLSGRPTASGEWQLSAGLVLGYVLPLVDLTHIPARLQRATVPEAGR